MKGHVWRAAAVTAAVTVVLVGMMANLDSARLWNIDLGRSQAIQQARDVASAAGLDASSWDAWVKTEADDRVRRFLEASPISETSQPEGSRPPALAPVFFAVRLEDPRGADRLEVKLDSDGNLLSFSLRPFRPPVKGPTEASLETSTVVSREAARTVATQALETLVDPGAGPWQLDEVQEAGEGSWRFLWLKETLETPALKWQAEVKVREGSAHDFSVEPILTAVPPQRNSQKNLSGIVNLLLILALLIYAVQSQRYRHPHRNILAFGLLTLVVGAVASTLRSGPSFYEGHSMLAVALGAFLDPVLSRALGASLLFGAGCAAGRRWLPATMAPVETLLAGHGRARNVASSVAFGVVSGLLLALLMAVAVLVVRAVGGPGAALLVASEAADVAARLPFLAALAPRLELAFLAYFAMVLPLACGLFQRPPLARLLASPVGALVLAPVLPVEGAPVVVLGIALLALAALDQVHQRAGLLAVLVAAWAFGAAARGGGLALQSGILSLSGWVTLSLLVGVAYGAARLARRTEASEGLNPESLALPRRLRAERERIRAQLSVAQEAQARMLPAAPPSIPGWNIAAVCRPAQEVGGDLYDFLPTADGRLGVLVGDVSGKGMVASLYMTLTKGLVLATSEETQAPAEVLKEVNEGLHQETERGVFVTAWLGLLDPATGHLRHSRAGHNPLLWRRARQRETVSLTPKGLPLGAVGHRMFSPSLEEGELLVEPGDAVFIYSDGLSEAMDAHRNEYGEDRLAATVGRTDGLSAERALDAVLADVDAFVGTAPQHDDMTLLVLRREEIPQR